MWLIHTRRADSLFKFILFSLNLRFGFYQGSVLNIFLSECILF